MQKRVGLDVKLDGRKGKMPREIKSPYWYRIWVDTCPVCGHEDISRERVYGIKPVNRQDCYVIRDYYDYCMENI